MENIIVLGIGNQLMMDDGIGINLVQELGNRDNRGGIQYIIGESDIDFCIEKIAEAAFVLIIDAVMSGKKPGELSIYPLVDLHECQPLNISPHNLHLFQVLYQQKETIEGYLIGVEPFELRFHIGLSKVLCEKWDMIFNEVEEVVDKLITRRIREGSVD